MSQRIASKIVELTKHIFLIKPAGDEGMLTQFMPGVRPRHSLSGISLHWWRTSHYERTLEEVADMVTELPEFSRIDLASVKDTVNEMFKEICVDKKYFYVEALRQLPKPTLLDYRTIDDVGKLSRALVDELKRRLRDRIINWCVVYAPSKLTGAGFSVPEEGIEFIPKYDSTLWHDLVEVHFLSKGFDPQAGTYIRADDRVFTGNDYHLIAAIAVSGLPVPAQLDAQMRVARVFALLLAVIVVECGALPFKVTANAYTRALQIPAAGTTTRVLHYIHLDPLWPHFASSIEVTASYVSAIQHWYQLAHALDLASRSRLEVAAHYFNKACSASGIDAFIAFFVSLDALFGVRGRVEESIVAGVAALNLGDDWVNRATRLFELRSELIHGGCRSVREWGGWKRYRRHFKSEPEDDVAWLGAHALTKAPALLPTARSPTRSFFKGRRWSFRRRGGHA